MVPLSTTPVVGLPRFDGWSQVSENSHSSFARLICSYSVSGNQAGNVGRVVSDRITRQTVVSGQEFFQFLSDLNDYVLDQECQLDMAAVLISRSSAFFASKNGKILLRRAQRVGKIVESQDDLKIVEGRYSTGDVYVLATFQSFDFASEVEQKLIQGFEPDTIVTSVVPSLHSLENSSLSAIAFVTDKNPGLENDEEAGESAGPAIEVSIDELGDTDNTPNKAQNKALGFLGRILGGIIGIFLSFFKWIFSLIRKLGQFIGGRFSTWRESGSFRAIFAVPIVGGTYLTAGSDNKLRKRFWLIVIVIIIIIGLAIGGWINLSNQRLAAKERVVGYYQQLDEARNIVEEDPISARAKVEETITQLETIIADPNSSRFLLSEANTALETAQILHEEISGLDELEELNVFYDLRLVRSEFVVTNADGFEPLAEADETQEPHVVFLDNQQNEIIFLNLSNKRVGATALENLSNVKDVRTNQDYVFILANGIHAYQTEQLLDETAEKTSQEIIVEGDSNREATLLDDYQIYLYTFNPERRNIYRYSESDGGYSDPIGWLQSTLGVAFEDVTSWSIDGDVWLGTRGGEIRRYLRGVSEPFTIQGMPDQFSTPITLATTVGSEILYVLEPSKNRVVFIDKESGAFIREVNSPSLASATNLIVSQRLGKIFPVSGSIIFEIDI